jgi:hypothetical protein
MGRAEALKAERRLWRVLTLEERADIAEEYQIEALLFCPHPWGVGRYWVNRETGESQRARCNRWDCLHCGPRKVNVWRQLVKLAEPTLFLTLTKAGNTVEEAARALTTFVQALRRGSKGKGRNHMGARDAYPIEYFAVLERHEDFERNGFHWHLLIKGVDSIPYKDVIKPLWMSATHYQPSTDEQEGHGAENGWIERIRSAKAIGYVTKYLMKAVSEGEKGTRDVERERLAVQEDEQGELHIGREKVTLKVASKAHRIRYSRGFFPERVAEMRTRLFAGVDATEEGKQANEQQEPKQRSPWMLVDAQVEVKAEIEEHKQRRCVEVLAEIGAIRDEDAGVYEERRQAALGQVIAEAREMIQADYWQRRRATLLSVLEDGRPISRRVIQTWHNQRQHVRLAG